MVVGVAIESELYDRKRRRLNFVSGQRREIGRKDVRRITFPGSLRPVLATVDEQSPPDDDVRSRLNHLVKLLDVLTVHPKAAARCIGAD